MADESTTRLQDVLDPKSYQVFEDMLSTWYSERAKDGLHVKVDCCGKHKPLEECKVVVQDILTALAINDGGELISGWVRVFRTAELNSIEIGASKTGRNAEDKLKVNW